MNDTALFLSNLRQLDVRVWAEDGRLKCSAPRGTLDPEIRAELSARKVEILALLRQAEDLKSLPLGLVPIRPEGIRPPIFAVSGHGDDIFGFHAMSKYMDPDQPLFGVLPPGLEGGEPLTSIEALARYDIDLIRHYRPNGPYLIAGHCSGGSLAFEVAQQLVADGQQVALLALIGSPFPTSFRNTIQIPLHLLRIAEGLMTGTLKTRWAYFISKLSLIRKLWYSERSEENKLSEARRRVRHAVDSAARAYVPKPYPGRVDLFVTADRWHRSHLWRSVAGTVRVHDLRDYKAVEELMTGTHAPVLAKSLSEAVEVLGQKS